MGSRILQKANTSDRGQQQSTPTQTLEFILTYSFTFFVLTALYEEYAGYRVPNARLQTAESLVSEERDSARAHGLTMTST